jgi:CubicO group peptidase (beta-lactamase class C family)
MNVVRGALVTMCLLGVVLVALTQASATRPFVGEVLVEFGQQLVRPPQGAPWLSSRVGRDLASSAVAWDGAVVEEIEALAVATHSRALLLLRGDDVVVDHSPEGRGPFAVASISKTISALAVARLVDEGHISFDDPLADTIVSWRSDDRAKVRVRDLLSHTSGLSGDLGVAVEPPGGLPSYHLGAYDVVPGVVEAKSGMPFPEFVDTHLLRPAGGTGMTWRRDEQGRPIASHGARITIDDLAVLGRLLLHGGFAPDGEVVRVRTLDEMMRPHGRVARGFGLGLFMHHPHDNALQFDIVEARGGSGHMVTVVPGKRAVLVRIGSGADDRGVPEQFHALLRRL